MPSVEARSRERSTTPLRDEQDERATPVRDEAPADAAAAFPTWSGAGGSDAGGNSVPCGQQQQSTFASSLISGNNNNSSSDNDDPTLIPEPVVKSAKPAKPAGLFYSAEEFEEESFEDDLEKLNCRLRKMCRFIRNKLQTLFPKGRIHFQAACTLFKTTYY